MFNAAKIKQDFPLFTRKIKGKVLTYLDSASTTQKPQAVLDALLNYYTTMNANIHRGVHTLSEEATEAYEMARQLTANFIHAKEAAEIVFTRNATEAFNLVAYTWGEQNIQEGDNVVVSALEHHSNLVPWQELCLRKKAELRIIPLDTEKFALEEGILKIDHLEKIITEKTKLVSISQMSNVLGTLNPLEKIIAVAHTVGAKVMVDGAQGVPHQGIDVQRLDIDFLAFSSHKMYGPTGVGILYGKRKLLEAMPPFLFGGEMVLEVKEHEASYNQLPWKFEAGTPNIADTIAYMEAIKYIQNVGAENILKHDQDLFTYARERLSEFPGLHLFGPKNPAFSGGILSFSIEGVHPHDIGSILNEEGIAIRAGHHCAQPLLTALKVSALARISFGVYNDRQDIDRVVEALEKVYKIFKISSGALS